MMKKILTMILLPVVGWLVKKVVEKVVESKQQHDAPQKVAPSV